VFKLIKLQKQESLDMKRLSAILLAISVFFFIRYEGYFWACTPSKCLTIDCPPPGCWHPPVLQICDDLECVERNLNSSDNIEHLDGVWRIDTDSNSIEKMEVTNKISVKRTASKLRQLYNNGTLMFDSPANNDVVNLEDLEDQNIERRK
jgi:hypothetical protein